MSLLDPMPTAPGDGARPFAPELKRDPAVRLRWPEPPHAKADAAIVPALLGTVRGSPFCAAGRIFRCAVSNSA